MVNMLGNMKMKKLLLATLISGLSVNAAIAAPSVYGKLDVSLDSINASNQSNVYKVDSNNSLFGIKGDEKLNDVLSVFYLAEWGISTDGDGTDLSQRNRYLGLKHEKFGSVKLGKFDSYVKRLGGQDLFDNYVANTIDIQGTLTGENRLNNTISYETPTIKLAPGDIQWNVLLAQGEDANKEVLGEKVSGTTGGAQAAGNHIADAVSTSLTYKSNIGVTAGLGYDHAVPSQWLAVSNGLVSSNIVRAVGTYDIKSIGLSLRALVQQAEVDKPSTSATANIAKFGLVDDETAFVLGAAYKIPNYDKFTVKGQYNQATTSFSKTFADYEVKQLAAGVDYAFNSKTRAYGYLAQNKKEQGSTEIKTNYGGVGLEYKF